MPAAGWGCSTGRNRGEIYLRPNLPRIMLSRLSMSTGFVRYASAPAAAPAASPSPARHTLPFEQPLAGLEQQIHELENLQARKQTDFSGELRQLRENYTALLKKTYDNLSAWETVQVARHPQRPQFFETHSGGHDQPRRTHGQHEQQQHPGQLAADERRFATAARVSEINLACYRTFGQPVVRALISEPAAEWNISR